METVTIKAASIGAERLLWTPVAGSYTAGLARYLAKSDQLDSVEAFTRVGEEAARVLGQCLKPGPADEQRTGLVIGYVQSGKTMSMTAVSALARDNGFRIVIAVSGTTENLYRQSAGRFERDLRGAQGGGSPLWVMLRNPNPGRAQRELQRLVNDWRDPRIQEEQQQTLFITVMKHHKHLENLSALLATANLAGIDALIIDDEADQASLNTRPTAPVESTTYLRLREIRRCLPKHTYLQYTATAQSLILISLLDMLSPDFADVLEAGEDYTGGRSFFIDRTDLVEIIPGSELPSQVTGSPEPPPSLLRALRMFFLAAVLSPMRSNEQHRSMLVHPDRRRGIQRSYVDWIQAIKDRWGDVLRRPDDDEERRELVDDFRQPFLDLQRSAGPLGDFDTLLRKLAVEIPRTQVAEVNSDGSEVNWDNGFLHILVGGQKLDRGYTVKGLVVTYMPRGPGTWTADTIQQRARFFGYKRPYLSFCRVFLESNILDLYVEYVEHEESLRDQIKRFRGRSTRELRRAFILDTRYEPTRRNILTEPFFRRQTGDGWFKQTSPHVAADVAANASRIEAFVGRLTFEDYSGFPQHQIATGVPLDDLLALLGEHAFGPADLLDAQVTIYHLLRHRQEQPSATVSVVLMGPGERNRSLRKADSDEIELHQGRSSKGAASYPGDAAIRDGEQVTLQVHWVNVRSSPGPGGVTIASRVPAVAVHLPASVGTLDWLVQPKAS
jgi:hypothetical protein